MVQVWQIVGLGVALALVLLPEPVTSTAGTLVGLGVIASMFGVDAGAVPAGGAAA